MTRNIYIFLYFYTKLKNLSASEIEKNMKDYRKRVHEMEIKSIIINVEEIKYSIFLNNFSAKC